jgi:hypothetical protein
MGVNDSKPLTVSPRTEVPTYRFQGSVDRLRFPFRRRRRASQYIWAEYPVAVRAESQRDDRRSETVRRVRGEQLNIAGTDSNCRRTRLTQNGLGFGQGSGSEDELLICVDTSISRDSPLGKNIPKRH